MSDIFVNTAPPSVQTWTQRHAAGLIITGLGSLALHTPIAASVFGVGSLLLLVAQHRGRWTESGAFGPANAVTAIRLVMIAGLAAIGFSRGLGPASALVVLAIFTLDGIDGWLARRSGQSSAFGAAFDMECDALLVLVSTLLLYQRGRLGAYILIPGFLRYAYSLGISFLPGGGTEVPPSRFGRHIFSVFAVSLIASLWPVEPIYAPLALIATLLVIWSFARALFWSLRHSAGAAHPPESIGGEPEPTPVRVDLRRPR